MNVTMRGAFGFQIINGGRMNYENVKNSRFENRLKSVNDLVFGKHTLSSKWNRNSTAIMSKMVTTGRLTISLWDIASVRLVNI